MTGIKKEDCMSRLNIALLQIRPGDCTEQNLEIGIRGCRKAKELGADLVLFPEMWSNGYKIHNRPSEEWIQEALPADGAFVKSFQNAAKELEMAIGVTFLERCGSGPKNTLLLFDCHGRQALKYSKIHTCDFDAEKHLTPGGDFYVTDLDTASGTVKIGAMICYDREYPESARILMLKGAEIILVPNACLMEVNRLSQLRGRAFENMVCIATCNYPEGFGDCNGHSTVFDGMAFKEDGDSCDMCILEAPEAEGIYLAELDLSKLRQYREQETLGNAYRHPKKYGELVSERRVYPFIREDYRE